MIMYENSVKKILQTSLIFWTFLHLEIINFLITGGIIATERYINQ
jgi:hypothetical protein